MNEKMTPLLCNVLFQNFSLLRLSKKLSEVSSGVKWEQNLVGSQGSSCDYAASQFILPTLEYAHQ